MEKNNYCISGVYFGTNKAIIAVKLHRIDKVTKQFGPGVKTSIEMAIRMRENGNQMVTILWDYNQNKVGGKRIGKWTVGAIVDVETLDNKKLLRTHKNKVKIDNLANLINYSQIDG